MKPEAVSVISVSELAQWLTDKNRVQPVLLDVREASEVQLCQIPGSLHMVMNSVPNRIDELDMGTPIVCICHHGTRSMQVARFLKQRGFDQVINLTGGVHAWALQVDPSMQTY
jgi:rhodanese-related sulfurtransferase